MGDHHSKQGHGQADPPPAAPATPLVPPAEGQAAAQPSASAGPETAAGLAHTHRQPNNPLHGVTLEVMLRYLVTNLGWPGLAQKIAVRCFATDPSMGSSLKFLRKTPWAREKVESLYLFMLREQKRHSRRPVQPKG